MLSPDDEELFQASGQLESISYSILTFLACFGLAAVLFVWLLLLFS